LVLPLQHVLDEIDAPPRAVPLVAQHHVSGAHRRAQPAMHAPLKNAVGLRRARIEKLLWAEACLHLRPYASESTKLSLSSTSSRTCVQGSAIPADRTPA